MSTKTIHKKEKKTKQHQQNKQKKTALPRKFKEKLQSKNIT